MPQESSQQPSSGPHRVALLVAAGSNPFEIGCACEIFGAKRTQDLGFEPYELKVVTDHGDAEMRDSLFTISAPGELADLADADTIIVPNRPDAHASQQPKTLDAIRAAHERGARLVGLCTGAFTLAEAGIMNGRPAAVHWLLAEEFRHRHPDVLLNTDVLFVDDGDLLTSAGSAAALDLSLHIVRSDYGAEVANHFSRRLVFAAARPGNQRQFVERAVPDHIDQSLAPLLDWALGNLRQPLTVSDLANAAHVSPTTLHRRFAREVGTTPLAWITQARIDLARQLLEHGGATLEVVARQSGLGSTANLRAQMHRHTGLSPAAYRASYRNRR